MIRSEDKIFAINNLGEQKVGEGSGKFLPPMARRGQKESSEACPENKWRMPEEGEGHLERETVGQEQKHTKNSS